MRLPKFSLALAASVGLLAGANSASALTTDLAFIMDHSNSISEANFGSAMGALADALDAAIPTNDPGNQYSITVIKFNDSAEVVETAGFSVANRLITSAADLTAVTNAIRNHSNSTSSTTCYSCAFDLLASTVTTLHDYSLINMMTDGEPNVGLTGGALQNQANNLHTATGWDSLSFEAINLDPGGTSLLQNLAFDTGGIGVQPVYTNVASITDPLNDSFVFKVASFGTVYDQAIARKIQTIVTPSIPLPAGLPLLLSGLGLAGALRLRRRKKAA